MNAIKKETLGTFTNIKKLVKTFDLKNDDFIQSAVLDFLEKRETNKHYEYIELKELIFKKYAVIKRTEQRREYRKSDKEKVFDLIEEFEGKQPVALVDDNVIDIIKIILTVKQFKAFDYWIENGLTGYKSNTSKTYNKKQKQIRRILSKLSANKALFDLLSEHKALDSFTDSYPMTPYKTGNKEQSKYSKKVSNEFIFDVKALTPDMVKGLVSDKIENKEITGKVIYSSKLVKTGKSKTVKTSSTGLTGYKKYTAINDFDRNEKKYLETVLPENMVHLKDEKLTEKKGMFHYHYSDSVYCILPAINNQFNLRYVSNNIHNYMIKIGLKYKFHKVIDTIGNAFTVTNSKGETQVRINKPYGHWLTIN